MGKGYLFGLLALGLAACETAVEVDIPQYPAKLTANTFFTPDSAWRVELTSNRYILDTTQFAAVRDAGVKIVQEGQTVATLRYQGDNSFGNSIYTSTDRRPKAGEGYTLEVTHPTMGSLAASNRVPVPQQILKATLDTSEVQLMPSFAEGNTNYALTIRFDDPPEENFYSISLFIRYDGFFSDDIDNDGEYEVWFEDFFNWLPIQSDDPVIDNPLDRYRVELFFKDVSFNGQQYQLTTYTDYSFPYFYLDGSVLADTAYDRNGNAVRYPGDTINRQTFYVLLRTTTEEYYQYNVTQDLQASVESNPFAQPVQVFDNIEGGLGIFAGYGQVEQEVTIK